MLKIAVEDSALAGDTVVVSNSNALNDPYEGFTLTSGVHVRAESGESPKISGSGADYAVDFPADATSSTILEGFAEITGGTYGAVRVRGSGVVRDCVINAENTGGVDYGILSAGTTTIDGVSVTLTGTYQSYGIYHSGGAPDISNCTVTLSETTSQSSTGIRVDASSPTTGGTVKNCMVTMRQGTGINLREGAFTLRNATVDFSVSGYDNIGISCGHTVGYLRGVVEDCLISVPAGSGVYILDDSVKVGNVTIDGVGTGIWAHQAVDVTVSNCIVTDYDGSEYAFQNVDAEYCIADGTTPYATGSQGTGSVVQDPLYCDAANGAFTLRVDSYGNPENNASGERIGAFDVACMYGTLARDAVYAGDGTLEFPGDLTIPSGKTLTLGSDTVLEIPLGDSQSGGSNSTRTELIVNGVLEVNGASGSEVTFTSSETTPAEGDWYGVDVKSGGALFMDHAVLEYAIYALKMTEPDSSEVTSSTFRNNQTEDLLFYWVSTSEPVAVEDNTITVGGGRGLSANTVCDGLTVADNTFVGSSTSTQGVYLFSSPGAVAVDNNTFDDFINGEAIAITSNSPILTRNIIDNCKYGILVGGGSAVIGTTSSSSDNVITNCTNGVRVLGASATPVLRNNQINSNTYGVVARSSGNPDMGTGSADKGNNTLLSNSTYCINNTTTGVTVLAYGNYFGSCSPPGCTNGNVITLGYLCSQPAGTRGPGLEVVGQATALRALGAMPNPMAAEGTIRFAVDEGDAEVSVSIFDISGRLVRAFTPLFVGAGEHAVSWNGRDNTGRPVRRGLYFVRITTDNDLRATAKVLVAR